VTAPGYVHRKAAYDLIVDGKSISGDVYPRLISLGLSERRGTDADELEIVLDDSDGRVAIPPAGAEISLKLGWRDLVEGGSTTLIDKGIFKVDARRHSGTPDRLTIKARSADLTRAFRTRRTQTWTETTLGQVLTDVAGRNGLQAIVAVDKASIEVAHLDQDRESDSAFLARLGRLHDAVATVKARRLLFAAVGSGETPGGTPIPPASLTRSDGDRHDWEAAERDSYSGVIAIWQDRSAGTRKEVLVGSADNPKRLGRIYGSERTARRAAESTFKRQARAGARFNLSLARGRPDLFPEQQLSLSGWKPQIDAADWLIAETRHSLTGNGGLTTTLNLELGGSGSSSG
jgi:uncharacterized protein